MENPGADPEKPPMDEKPGYPPSYETSDPLYDQVTSDTGDDCVVVLAGADDILAEDANNDGIADDALFEFPAHVRLDYDHTVSEPDYFMNTRVGRVFQPVTACLRTWFNGAHTIMYFVLCLLLGSVLAVLWGLVFGIVNFFTVWFVQPFIKLFFTAFRCAYMVSRVWTRMFCDPCFESIALALSKIRGNVTINMKGLVHEQ